MAEIAIDFLRGPGVTSWLISRFGFGTGGYSHVASVLADGRYIDARNEELFGVPAGVHIRQAASEPWVRKRRATFQVSQATYDEWERNSRAKIGDQYDREGILDFILGRNIHLAGHYFCSAFMINELQHVKLVPYPLPVLAHEISPDSALLIVATAGATLGPEVYA